MFADGCLYFGMMQVEQIITALEVQKRNSDRVSVYLDGEFAFGLPIDEAARLRKGQSLTLDEVTALRDIDAISRALDYAVKLLARRPYSTSEIRRKLSSREVASPVIDEALARLERLGYVDDRAFVQYWIENRERFRPRGSRALRYELRQKGIADAVIAEALEGFDQHDSAYRAAQSRLRQLRGSTTSEFRSKLGAYLARQGFGYDVARQVIDEWIHALQDEQPTYFDTESENDYNEE